MAGGRHSIMITTVLGTQGLPEGELGHRWDAYKGREGLEEMNMELLQLGRMAKRTAGLGRRT